MSRHTPVDIALEWKELSKASEKQSHWTHVQIVSLFCLIASTQTSTGPSSGIQSRTYLIMHKVSLIRSMLNGKVVLVFIFITLIWSVYVLSNSFSLRLFLNLVVNFGPWVGRFKLHFRRCLGAQEHTISMLILGIV